MRVCRIIRNSVHMLPVLCATRDSMRVLSEPVCAMSVCAMSHSVPTISVCVVCAIIDTVYV